MSTIHQKWGLRVITELVTLRPELTDLKPWCARVYLDHTPEGLVFATGNTEEEALQNLHEKLILRGVV